MSTPIEFSEKKFKKIDPIRLVEKERQDILADFFLVLGLFYNDLKSLTFHTVQTNNKFENLNKNEVSVNLGEYAGIKNHLERLTMSTIYEFFEFISKNQEALKTTEFNLIYKNLNIDLKNRWDLIVDVSIGNKKDRPKEYFDMYQILLLVRHNATFHYYQTSSNLRNGFIQYFYKDAKNTFNEYAYYSIGEGTMQNTRFYYCDASVKSFMLREIRKKFLDKDFNLKFNQTIDDLNFTIMSLMKAYLDTRPHYK